MANLLIREPIFSIFTSRNISIDKKTMVGFGATLLLELTISTEFILEQSKSGDIKLVRLPKL